jgi:hypothetical protein
MVWWRQGTFELRALTLPHFEREITTPVWELIMGALEAGSMSGCEDVLSRPKIVCIEDGGELPPEMSSSWKDMLDDALMPSMEVPVLPAKKSESQSEV